MTLTSLKIMAFATIPLAMGLSYLLAKAGEPQSVWLWHTVLGVL